MLILVQLWKPSRQEQHWKILSAFPIPVPVRHNSAVLPRFFTTEKDLGLPFLPLDDTLSIISDNRSLVEIGSLCFTLNKFSNSCVILSKQKLGWFKDNYRKKIF